MSSKNRSSGGVLALIGVLTVFGSAMCVLGFLIPIVL